MSATRALAKRRPVEEEAHHRKAVRSECSICCESGPDLLPCDSCGVFTCISCVQRRGTHPYSACFSCEGGKIAPPSDLVSEYVLKKLLHPWQLFRYENSKSELLAALLAVWNKPAPPPELPPQAPSPAPVCVLTIPSAEQLNRDMALFVDEVCCVKCCCGVKTPVMEINLNQCIDLTCPCGYVLCAICGFVSFCGVQARHHALSTHRTQFCSPQTYCMLHLKRVYSGLNSLATLRNTNEELYIHHPLIKEYVRSVLSVFLRDGAHPVDDHEPFVTCNRQYIFDIFDLLNWDQRSVSLARTLILQDRKHVPNIEGIIARVLGDYMNTSSPFIECATWLRKSLTTPPDAEEQELLAYPLSAAIYVELERNMEALLRTAPNATNWDRFRFKVAASSLFLVSHSVLGAHLVNYMPRRQRANLFGLTSALRSIAGNFVPSSFTLDPDVLQVDEVDAVGAVHPELRLRVWGNLSLLRKKRFLDVVNQARKLEQKRLEIEIAVQIRLSPRKKISEYVQISNELRILLRAGRFPLHADIDDRHATELAISSMLVREILREGSVDQDSSSIDHWCNIIRSGLPVSIVDFEAVLRHFVSRGEVQRAFQFPGMGFTIAQRELVLFIRDNEHRAPEKPSNATLLRVFIEDEITFKKFNEEEFNAYKRILESS